MAKNVPVSSGESSPQPGPTPSPKEFRALQVELNHAQSMITQLREEIDTIRRQAQDAHDAKNAAARLSEELERRNVTQEQQREVAQQFQKLFLPPALPHFDDVHFAVNYLPCERVGGDFYDVFDMGNGCLGILVADISGFGLAATLVTAVAKMGLDTYRQNEFSPKVIMEKMNAQVAKVTLSNQFITAFLGILDLETFRLKYVNASHPCPVLCGPDRFELLDTEGLCCGMFENPRYEEKEIQLKSGDRILLYTRGLISTADAKGQPYENAELYEYLQDNPETNIETIVAQVGKDFLKHIDGQEQTDDVILVALELSRHETAEQHLVLTSDPQQLRRVEEAVLPQLEAYNYGERVLFGVRLALEEALVNAIKHGNNMDKTKKVIVTYAIDDKECRISIEDEGSGFDPKDIPDPTAEENLERPHGRGVMLIRAYMDEVSYNEKGNRITMRMKAPWAE